MRLLQSLDPDKWKIRRHTLYYLNFIAAHVFTIWWLTFAFNWSAVALGLAGYFLFGKIGGDIGYHRYFCHRSFKTTLPKEWLMLICGLLTGTGSSIIWAAMHAYHHEFVDGPADPHSPQRIGFWRCYLYLYDYKLGNERADTKFMKLAIRDKKQVFLHKNYFKIYYGFILLLGLISYLTKSWNPLAGLWGITVVLVFHASGVVNAVCHTFGYQNYSDEKSGKSTNNTWLNLVLWGNGLHNNHHGVPRSYTFVTKKSRWYEFDLWGKFIEIYFMEKN